MNTLNTVRIAVACSAALFSGLTFADTPTDPSQSAPSASQDVGGTPMTDSAAGAPQPVTHAQVYQDLVHSMQSGEHARLNKELYHGQ